jgi:hypothetical protein
MTQEAESNYACTTQMVWSDDLDPSNPDPSNPDPAWPVIVILDNSATMMGTRMSQAVEWIRQFLVYSAQQQRFNDVGISITTPAIVTNQIRCWQDFPWDRFSTAVISDLGEALAAAFAAGTERKAMYRSTGVPYHYCRYVLLTDGKGIKGPKWDAAIEAMQARGVIYTLHTIYMSPSLPADKVNYFGCNLLYQDAFDFEDFLAISSDLGLYAREAEDGN